MNYNNLSSDLCSERGVTVNRSRFKCTQKITQTTDDVEGAESDVVKAVERPFSGLLLQFLYEHLRLLIHHLKELSQYREMKCWSQHLTSASPLIPSTNRKENRRVFKTDILYISVDIIHIYFMDNLIIICKGIVLICLLFY